MEIQSRWKVVQINLHHSKQATYDLLLFMEEEKIEVALIQEPWIVGNKVSGLQSQYFSLHLPPTEGKIRTCILCRKRTNLFLLPQYCTGDMTTVIHERKNGTKLVLASVYMDYNEPDPPPVVFQTLSRWTEQQKLHLVAGCDANAHHTLWGSSNINERGESLFEFLLSTNLIISNKGNHPTYFNKNREEVIDITLVTNSENIEVQNWRVSEECSSSDHYRILFDLNLDISRKPLSGIRRRQSGTNFQNSYKECYHPHPRGY